MPELEQTFTVIPGAIRERQLPTPQQHLDHFLTGVENCGRPYRPLGGIALVDTSHDDDLRKTTPPPLLIAPIFEVINDLALIIEFESAALRVAFVQSPRLGQVLLGGRITGKLVTDEIARLNANWQQHQQ